MVEASEIQRHEVDGVLVLHLPIAGPTIATISFRVGRCDEPIPMMGITHLIEHLIMGETSRPADHANGQTGPYRVTLIRRGTPAQCSILLGEACESIRHLPMRRMGDEVNILRTEAEQRGRGLFEQLASLRYGYQGLGTLALPEFFLRRPDPMRLDEWIDRYFVGANAVVWIAGELPEDLALPLPAGSRQVVPASEPIDGLRTPTLVEGSAPAVAASFVVPRSVALSTGMSVLDARLRQALRLDRGLAYDIGADRVLMGRQEQMFSVWASCLPDAAPEVTAEFLRTLDTLATQGPTESELRERSDQMLQYLVDPMAAMARLDSHAEDLLLGESPPAAAELADQMAALRPEVVAAAMRDAQDAMLLLTPAGPPTGRERFEPYPEARKDSLGKARTFAPAKERPGLPGLRPAYPRLVVGDRGVGVDLPTGRAATVLWEDAIAVIDNGASREVLGRDGFGIPVEASQWIDGYDALRLISTYAPTSVRIPRPPWIPSVAALAEPTVHHDRRRLLPVLVVGAMMALWWSMSSRPPSGLAFLVGATLTIVVALLTVGRTRSS